MKRLIVCFFVVSAISLVCGTAQAVSAPPADAWHYVFEGDAAGPALDGTWDHDNGSDQWDETGIGAGRPGGISALVDGDTDYLRLQDTGDPRDYGMGDPGSNRKLYLGHLANEIPEPAGILDSGQFSLALRARIATGDPLDDRHPDGGSGIVPWPAEGNGYMGHDKGKGNFTMGQDVGGSQQISFSLAWVDLQKGVLMMNNLNGNTPTDKVDPYDPGEGSFNGLMFNNPTDWHDFLISVAPDATGVGTHAVGIQIDGGTDVHEFIVTAGTDNEYAGNFIGLGLGSTGQWGAIDVDYIAYQIPEPATIALLGLGGLLLIRRRRR